MNKYKVGDRVIIEKCNIGGYEGEIGVIKDIIVTGCGYDYCITTDTQPYGVWCKVKSLAPEYKIGDHVVCEKSNVPSWDYNGKTGVINRIDTSYAYPYLITMDDGSEVSWCTVKCLVEEKKMFTASDLKTGMFGIMDNGDQFVVVNDLIVYMKGGYDFVSNFKNDMDCGHYRITKVYEGIKSFTMLTANIRDNRGHGTLVYEYIEKPLYNGKVVCIGNTANPRLYTVGKIYQFKDGQLTADNGRKYPGVGGAEIHTFDDWAQWTASKFIEVKE